MMVTEIHEQNDMIILYINRHGLYYLLKSVIPLKYNSFYEIERIFLDF